MRADVIATDDTGIAIGVIDNEGNEHRLALTWDGTVDVHETDAFARDPAERTAEEERTVQQVEERARFEAHHETEGEILEPTWRPANLEAAMDAIRAAGDATIREHFRELFDAVQNPEQHVDGHLSTVHRVRQGLCVNPDENELATVGELQFVEYVDGGTGEETVGSDPTCSDGTLFARITLPPLEFQRDDFTFPESFQGLLVSHFMCQIRDVYLNMGEEPPEPYLVEGAGKPATYYDADLNLDG